MMGFAKGSTHPTRLFGEALSPVKITGIVLVMAGIVVLKMATV